MKRIDLILKDPEFIEYLEHNNQAAKDDPFCKHDLSHMIDVARIAYILVLEKGFLNYFIENAGLKGRAEAKEVIYATGLLHDIGKWKEYEAGIDHAAFGARLARDILIRAGYEDHEIEVIGRAIYEHRNISQNMSFLGERMHRADNLSRACSKCKEKDNCCKRTNRENGPLLLY